jgi:hypothetical protein
MVGKRSRDSTQGGDESTDSQTMEDDQSTSTTSPQSAANKAAKIAKKI